MGGSKFETDYNDHKVAKLVVIKQKTKIHIQASYFALKLDLNCTNKERKYNTKLVKNFIFSEN